MEHMPLYTWTCEVMQQDTHLPRQVQNKGSTAFWALIFIVNDKRTQALLFYKLGLLMDI